MGNPAGRDGDHRQDPDGFHGDAIPRVVERSDSSRDEKNEKAEQRTPADDLKYSVSRG